jgi:CheY-like chemotaxis protein
MSDRQEVTLFLIEDDDVDAMSIERSFKKQRIGNTIIRAKYGMEALEMLNAGRVPEPFLILLDLNMPRMNGLEFLKSLRLDGKLNNSVVFVLTTSSDDKDIVSSYSQHIAGYFVKSEAGQGFNGIVDMLQGYWKIAHLPNS